MRIDLRLAVPAMAAWVAAFVSIAVPSVWVVVACWVVAAAVTAVAFARGRAWAVVALAAAVAAMVCSSAAVQAQQRQPPALVELASHSSHVSMLLETTQTTGPHTSPFSARLVAVGDVGYSSPVLVFGATPTERTGIGTRFALEGTLAGTSPDDDTAFLVFGRGALVKVADPPWFLDWANGLRSGFASASSALPGEGGQLLPGLAIGDTGAVSSQLDSAMKATSLSHLTAVSGANCAVIIGLIMAVGGAAGVSRGVRIGSSLSVLVGFVVLVTPEPSVLRAAVMATLVLVALGGGRPVRGIPVLSLAVIALLVIDPWLSRNFGFALSVLATGGLLTLAGPLARWLTRFLPLGVAAAVSIPLAAQLACQPVLLMLNSTLPTYGIVANILAEPAAPIATVVGLLACVALPAAPGLGGVLAHVAWLPSAWIAAVARFFAGLPGAAIPWPAGLAGVGLLAVITVLLLLLVFGFRRRAVAAALVVVLVGWGAIAGGSRISQVISRPADWQIAACDVGQGDAVFVRSAGQVALIDTGREPALMTKCLDELGISHIDLLVLTHFDMDHIGGTSAVYGMVDRAFIGPIAEPADEGFIANLVANDMPVEQVSRGPTGLLGELRWEVIWPPAHLGSIEPGNPASVTLEFLPAGQCASGCLSSLFLGDLPESSQSRIAATVPLPVLDVVKVSHHGSADQSPRLYEAIRATVGVIGVGADNTYGHPTQKLLEILESTGTWAARTDRYGLILLSPGATPGTVSVWTEKPGDDGAAG
ncbi:MAG: ComEC/Rec2 family competence protein [Rhodoglobus sp.]